jgi:hypothetical protein
MFYMSADEIGHSKLGIASFLIGIGSFITAVLLVLVTVFIVTGRNISELENKFAIFVVYYVLFFVPAIQVVGLISGICGCLQTKRRKSLATIGTGINLLFLVIQIGIRSYFSGVFLR